MVIYKDKNNKTALYFESCVVMVLKERKNLKVELIS